MSSGIDNLHNNFFQKVFSEVANAETFLKVALPAVLQARLDLTDLTLDSTSYVSEEYKASFSDLVVKCRTKTQEFPVDVYLLFEHKSHPDKGVPVQLLRYMSLAWQRDHDEKKPLRVIIPLVFYHGESEWRIPTQFHEQFAIEEELKPFLLNFSYVLFDANVWDWQAESSQPLRANVFLLSAMMLMKAAFRKDLELIRQVFRLWHQLGFMREEERIIFLLIYVTATHDIPVTQLEQMLEDSNLNSNLKGDDIMPTLAQRWIEQGMERGMEKGMEKGIEKGYLLDRQEVLIMLLSTRFQLHENEKQIIRAVNEIEKLTAALKLVVAAQTKDEILKALQNGQLQSMPPTLMN